jgi:hypothetical protein
MSEGWGLVGCKAWIDNPASVFHGLCGEVLEIDGAFSKVRVRTPVSIREVWFQGWELREDRSFSFQRKSPPMRLRFVEEDEEAP